MIGSLPAVPGALRVALNASDAPAARADVEKNARSDPATEVDEDVIRNTVVEGESVVALPWFIMSQLTNKGPPGDTPVEPSVMFSGIKSDCDAVTANAP
jgi:hypothetical protein